MDFGITGVTYDISSVSFGITLSTALERMSM